MSATVNPPNGTVEHLVRVGQERPGQFTARAAGLPDVVATAATRQEALDQVCEQLRELRRSGQLVTVEVHSENALLQAFGKVDPNNPNEQAYLEELARNRQEDLERTLREIDSECSNTSSIPTT
jgi:hypothetical protein